MSVFRMILSIFITQYARNILTETGSENLYTSWDNIHSAGELPGASVMGLPVPYNTYRVLCISVWQ